MASVNELMASGMPAAQASKLGSDPVTTFSAAGSSSQTNATALTASFANVTTVAANAGVRLPSAGGKGFYVVLNNGANILSVYPATGEKINGAAANAAIVVGVGKCAILFGDNNQWGAVVGA